MSTPSNNGEAPETANASHNSEANTAAADAELCGMTHLASGRVCLLPKRHRGGCEFREETDVEAAIELR
jgi:hypothetical protein